MKDTYREHLRRSTPTDLDGDFEKVNPRRRAAPMLLALAAAVLLVVLSNLSGALLPPPDTQLYVQVEGQDPVELELTLEKP